MKFSEDTSNRLLRALNYPYWRPRQSYLYASGSVLHLASPCTNDLKRSRIVDPEGNNLSLEEYARKAGWPAAELERQRIPLVAHGSNASPIQLSIKFPDERNGPTTIPVITGVLQSYAVVYAAQLSLYGAVPATLVHDRNSQTGIHICLVTEQQLEELNRSEGLGDRYELLSLPEGVVTLADDTIIKSPLAYIATGGALFARNSYWQIQATPDGSRQVGPTADQRSIQQLVMELLHDPREVEEFIVELLNNPDVRLSRNRALRSHSRSFADTLPGGGQ